jgi:hypothetical protein
MCCQIRRLYHLRHGCCLRRARSKSRFCSRRDGAERARNTGGLYGMRLDSKKPLIPRKKGRVSYRTPGVLESCKRSGGRHETGGLDARHRILRALASIATIGHTRSKRGSLTGRTTRRAATSRSIGPSHALLGSIPSSATCLRSASTNRNMLGDGTNQRAPSRRMATFSLKSGWLGSSLSSGSQQNRRITLYGPQKLRGRHGVAASRVD